jgi:5'-nucleotidase
MINILLVNDDGYYAEGIQRLKSQLYEYGNVYTIAPKNAMSAKATSITVGKPINYEKIDDFNYVVDGTPADCVDLAITKLKLDIDLVISGCNRGLNDSIASRWSGTLGACIQAGYLGYPTIAFSACPNHMEHAEIYAKQVMDYILKYKLPNMDNIISVNFPYTEKALGIKLSRLSFNKRKVTWGTDGNLYQDKNGDIDFDDEDSDLYQTSHGYISITPLALSIFHEEDFHKFKKITKDEIFTKKTK